MGTLTDKTQRRFTVRFSPRNPDSDEIETEARPGTFFRSLSAEDRRRVAEHLYRLFIVLHRGTLSDCDSVAIAWMDFKDLLREFHDLDSVEAFARKAIWDVQRMFSEQEIEDVEAHPMTYAQVGVVESVWRRINSYVDWFSKGV